MSPATIPSNLTAAQKWQLGMMYMQQYAQQLNVNQSAMVAENEKNPDRKFYTWDEFWQVYNRLWNLGQYEAVLLHVKMNYINGFNRGKF